jgi:hypothetical protein
MLHRRDDNLRKIRAMFVVMLFVVFAQPAQAEIDRQGVFEFLQDAFSAQLELTTTVRSMDEIYDILDPYFTNEYQSLFLDRHLYEEEDGYIIYGTDVFDYVVPFFSYNEDTKLSMSTNEIVAYERFEAFTEEHTSRDDHFIGVRLTNTESGWKISEYIHATEEPSLDGTSDREAGAEKQQQQKVSEEIQTVTND